MASRSLGASNTRIIFRHILPNTLSLIITFVPFSITGGITSLTSLDYLGFGLPPPTPSWGELLKQGTDNLDALDRHIRGQCPGHFIGHGDLCG